MKKVILAMFCAFIALSGHGQGFAVAVDKVNVLYEGIDNPLTIVVANHGCDKIEVITDNGTLTKSTERCAYRVSRAKVGNATFIVYAKEGASRRAIDTIKYRVLAHPLPDVTILGTRNRSVKYSQFSVQKGLITSRQIDYDESFPIISFTCDVLRAGTVAFTRSNRSAYFDDVVKRFMATGLRPGDRVIFREIKCEVAGRVRELESFYVDIAS